MSNRMARRTRPDYADEAGKTSARRRDLPSEVAGRLLPRAQRGEVSAQHALSELFAPLLHSAIAPYRTDFRLYDDLCGEVQLIFHRLILQYDPGRGVNLFTYMQRTLPAAVWSWVRRQRRTAQREIPWAGARAARRGRPDGDTPGIEWVSWGETKGVLVGSSAPGELEDAVVNRLALEQAMQRLTDRQRHMLRLRALGYDYVRIAETVDATPEACRQVVRRARACLRAVLQEDGCDSAAKAQTAGRSSASGERPAPRDP